MENTFITFNTMSDELITITPRTIDDYAVILNKDVIIQPKDVLKYKSKIIITPNDYLYRVYSCPTETETITYLIHFFDLEENDNVVEFYIYNTTDAPILLKTGDRLGHFFVAKPVLREGDGAFYDSGILLIKEREKGIIEKFTYIDDPLEGPSLLLKLNKTIESDNVPCK